MRYAFPTLFAIVWSLTSLSAHADALTTFIDDMAARHGFAKPTLQQWFAKAKVKKSILRAMNNPGEALPWHEYYPRFINDKRINGGVAFMRRHAEVLQRAEQQYGVPPEIVTAIVGVETAYGSNTGGYRVLDALTTLAFHYPKRADFFRGELEEFLLMVKEEKLSPLKVKGSYAGAMGIGQFIPSSYRKYGIDFDGDGKRQLAEVTDAIGSIAHYLHKHGWQRGAPVTLPAEVPAKDTITLGIKTDSTLGKLQHTGVVFEVNLPATTPAGVFALETESGTAYWLSLNNFYVITRYNRSSRYAMAVYQLAEAIQGAAKE